MKSTKLILVILISAFCFALVRSAMSENSTEDGVNGNLLWQDQYDAMTGFDETRAIAVKGNRVFVAGYVENVDIEWDTVFTVRAYDARTGRLLWQDQFGAMNGFDEARAIAVEGNRVFVAGYVYNEGKGEDFAIRAYDVRIGRLLWQDQFDGTARRNDWASCVAASEGRVFAAGSVQNEDTTYDFTIRTYDAKTGSLLWQDQYNGGWSESARAIAVKGSRVFVAGSVWNAGTHGDFAVRAYDAKTGRLLWQDQFDGTANYWDEHDEAGAIAVKGNWVFVAGVVENGNIKFNTDFTIRTYDARTGRLLWQDQFDGTAKGWNVATSVATKGSRVFVAGFVTNEDTGRDFAIRAYNVKTGKLLWQDQFDGSSGTWDEATAIAVKESHVFVAGYVNNVGTRNDFTVRAYDAVNGNLLWQDQFDGSSNEGDGANAIAVAENRIFVAGYVNNVGTRNDFTVRAYKAISTATCDRQQVTIIGTEGHDFLKGTSGPDVIHGLGGNDVIQGLGGDDVICGGDGSDVIGAGSGNDVVLGENGHDAIWGGPGNDSLRGGDGNDSIYGGPGNDSLHGNHGNDSLYGTSGVDKLYGGWGPNSGSIDNNDTCYDTAGTFTKGCEVFYEQ